ncbi:MAG: GntR family transcriptional regulator [Desulfobacterales bacterium]|nr:GntR family transcriptional regulator [Desulfobacterales bacterium]
MNKKASLFQKDPTNTPDLIANALRNAILQGRYKANQPLRQDHIAQELGVSKIPLREALVQLKAEGLVSFMPNRGAVVSELSAYEVDEIFTMRIALETKALERAIPNLSSADFIRAKSVLEILEKEKDRTQWSELNWEFHATLYQASQMPRLLNIIETLHNNVTRYLIIYLDRLSAQDISQKEHLAIFNACKRLNIDAAINQLTTHLRKASKRLIAFLS